MSDDHPFGGARRSRMGPAVLIAALVLVIGLGLMIFAIRDEPGWLRRGSDAGTAARTTTQPAQQAPAAAAVDTETLSQRETALAAQIASLEARAATLGSSTANAEGRASRAEAILIAFAARRAIDRGLGLGYLEEQIRARFAGAPREASAVIRASRNPVTLESLRQDLDTAAPVLLARESSWWGGLGAELRNLVVIHKAGTPSPLPADRLARVRRLVDAGRVEEALVEVRRLPGAANAASWTSAAQRYVDAHRALDQLETIAIVGPVAPPAAASGQVIQSPALPIQPQPAPTADLGNYL